MRPESGHETVRLFLKEMIRHKWAVAFTFVALSVLGFGLGIVWPDRYTSSVTIDVEQKNIIDPLLQGRAVRTAVTDLSRNAREVIDNRSFLLAALQDQGWVNGPDAGEAARLVAHLRSRTHVTDKGNNLIRIDYSGDDPQKTYEMTRELGHLLIQKMLQSKERESGAAFNFIDTQVKKYEDELHKTQMKMEALQDAHPNTQPGASDDLVRRQASLRTEIDNLEQQIREARIQEASLQSQLSGEAEVGAVMTRAQRYQSRIADLTRQLETLRLSYHETYPDIVQLKQQIADLKDSLKQEQERARANPKAAEAADIDATTRSNPVYQKLQQALYNVHTNIKTLEARLEFNKDKLADLKKQSHDSQSAQSDMERLRRDYQVNQDIYEDLLRRRENARVSKNLDSQQQSEQQGLSIRVQEPAYLPHTPDGPNLLHFVLAGSGLGLAVPFGVLLLFLNLDPRIREASQLPPEARSLLLASLPHTYFGHQRQGERAALTVSLLLMLACAVSVGVLTWIHMSGAA